MDGYRGERHAIGQHVAYDLGYAQGQAAAETETMVRPTVFGKFMEVTEVLVATEKRKATVHLDHIVAIRRLHSEERVADPGHGGDCMLVTSRSVYVAASDEELAGCDHMVIMEPYYGVIAALKEAAR